MLFGHYFMQVSNWLLFILPVVALFKRLRLAALITFSIAVFSNLYHYAYNEDATYTYILQGYTCAMIVNITETTLQACENLLIWDMPNTMKYAFLICDYSSSNLGFITLAVYLMPKRKMDMVNVTIFFGWLFWLGISGVSGVLMYHGLFPANSIYVTPFVAAYVLLAFAYHWFEYNHVPLNEKESVWLFYQRTFNSWMLLLGLFFMFVGAFSWIVIQNLFGYYFITHPTWHLCTVISGTLILSSIKAESVFYENHTPIIQLSVKLSRI